MKLKVDNDIYFDPRLGRIYAQLEGGEFDEFHFQCRYGTIRHQFILRSINSTLGEKDTWNDLTTPYGYGGPVILEGDVEDYPPLMEAFENAFRKYCEEHRVVSEFIRFHPIVNQAEAFQAIYDVHLHNWTVGTNLRDYEDPIMEEFSKSARKTMRRALQNDLSYVIEEGCDSIEEFQKIYYETMDRNEAGSDYYFPTSYFDDLRHDISDRLLSCRVLYQGETVSMSLCFHTDDILHVHLSGTKDEFLHLSPAYVLRYAYVLWAQEQGLKLIHYGGGTTGSPDDSLFLFKKKFGRNTQFPFYLGKKIWNKEVYRELVARSGQNEKIFFPAYRQGEQ